MANDRHFLLQGSGLLPPHVLEAGVETREVSGLVKLAAYCLPHPQHPQTPSRATWLLVPLHFGTHHACEVLSAWLREHWDFTEKHSVQAAWDLVDHDG